MLSDSKEEYTIKIKKLMVEFTNDRMPDNEFINSFMPRVYDKMIKGYNLTDIEKRKLDELFEKH